MNHKIVSLALMLPVSLHATSASAATFLQEMNLHTMLETTTSVLTTLGDYTKANPDGISDGTSRLGAAGLSWTGTFNDSGWTYSGSGALGGVPLSMQYSGTLSGSNGSDIIVSVFGNGLLGSMPLNMQGSTRWYYDSATDDYQAMDFSQLTKIGSNSLWGWVVGAEFLVGVSAGVVSGLVAGGAITIGTAGAGAPAGLAAGLKTGLVVGGAATVGSTAISAAVKTTLAEDQPPAPVAANRPTLADPLKPSNVGTIVTDDGKLHADDMSNAYRSTADYSANGNFSGTTFSVPEPTSVSMLFLGLLGLLGGRKWRARAT